MNVNSVVIAHDSLFSENEQISTETGTAEIAKALAMALVLNNKITTLENEFSKLSNLILSNSQLNTDKLSIRDTAPPSFPSVREPIKIHENVEANDWQMKLSHKSKLALRNGEGRAENDEIKAAKVDFTKKATLYISNVVSSCDENLMLSYLKKRNIKILGLYLLKLKTQRAFNSFKLIVESDDFEIVNDTSFWPKGIIHRHWVNFKDMAQEQVNSVREPSQNKTSLPTIVDANRMQPKVIPNDSLEIKEQNVLSSDWAQEVENSKLKDGDATNQ
ncbi:hypothetical protein HELRODRAFT_184261 [Helobdella robusta]|uniref:Uncharacterized protein n=1 Tax=Helobdella robusta TaxID=6412 RepID=T1FKV3_HELRO|nr:hypothetical protein HELRODRAFT_184261 [Helobdella robusta]ESO04125.1 hypothetical protein HELRODRAFT_184261 [Helobdella robusta]